MVTLEDIERELDPSEQEGFVAKRIAKAKYDLIAGQIKKLKKQEQLVGEQIVEGKENNGVKYTPENRIAAIKLFGSEIVKSLLLGKRKLTEEEYTAAIKKFGVTGVNGIEALEHLNKAQKQYLFKQMGYPIEEVE